MMQRALKLAEKALYTTDPNPRVGCVIARDGQVVGEGWHKKSGEAHAEPQAIQMAGDGCKGATAYVTLEPCFHYGKTPPCSGQLIDAGVKRVVIAMLDPDHRVSGQGAEQLRAACIQVDVGLMQDLAVELNLGFISRQLRQKPWVRVKMASSLDARTAMQSGESKWISGPASRRDVQHWRARSSAILTGIGTILADNPNLNVRLENTQRQPWRVVVDSIRKMPLDSQIFKQGGPVIWAGFGEGSGLKSPHLSWTFEQQKEGVNLHDLLRRLADHGINELMVEAGSHLCGALLENGLVDELLLYQAAHIMGSSAQPLFDLNIEKMKDRKPLVLKDIRQFGDDIRSQWLVPQSEQWKQQCLQAL